MEARNLKRKNNERLSPVYEDEDDYSTDDINCNDEFDSDDDYDEPVSRKRANRLQSSYETNEFRNTTPSPLNDRKQAVQRMPTRRPNPKISNRNAIMARENRRKKKEFMETLQKNADDTQSENKKLKKLLRIRNNAIEKLTQESIYLRSILANKTEIMSLLKTIQGNRTPITSSTLSFVTNTNYQCNEITSNKRINSTGCSPASSMSSRSMCTDEDEKENGTVTANDPFLSTFIEQNFLFTDLASTAGDPFEITTAASTSFNNDSDFHWENLLSDTNYKSDLNPITNIPDLRDIDDSEILSTHSSKHNVINEHNYFNNPITKKVNADKNAPGICLHVASGRVSLEFCASCHQSSQNAWIEEM